MKEKLTPEILKMAYSRGYFPMAEEASNEIYWYHPDPRAVIPLESFHVSKSLRKTLNKGHFTVSIDKDFGTVINACADREETWINSEFKDVYAEAHHQGWAHSVEVWEGENLAGGLYGVTIGAAFFAESMFYNVTDASKVALHHLVSTMKAKNMTLLEVQFITPHLKSLGAVEISRDEYLLQLIDAISRPGKFWDKD